MKNDRARARSFGVGGPRSYPAKNAKWIANPRHRIPKPAKNTMKGSTQCMVGLLCSRHHCVFVCYYILSIV